MALRAFLRDVTAAILVFQNNETVARMLVFQTNPNGFFFLCKPLPVDIRSIDDVNKFKSKLKTFLFKRVYELS